MSEVRIIIAGSRDFHDYGKLRGEVIKILYTEPENRVIISGCAKGADTLGERFAEEYHLPLRKFPADWKTYGKKAGILRNIQMAKYATGDDSKGVLIAFWDGMSHGTGHMIRIAEEYNMDIHVVRI